MEQNFDTLMAYAKSFSGITPESENLLKEASSIITPKLSGITEDFYRHLLTIPEATRFLEGRVELLKTMHTRWLESLFIGPFDKAYVEYMYKVGHVHVKVDLPVEFMAGGMTLINNRLVRALVEVYADNSAHLANMLEAVNAITGMSLFIMQQSYQEASIAVELERFLKITGISRTLFGNLSLAYKV